MDNKKFLGNKYVTVVRYFDYKGTLKAAVKDHTGKVFAVNASELTHVRNTGDEEVAESVSEPVSKVEDDEVVVGSPESPSEDTKETDVEETFELEPEPELEPEVQEVTETDSEPEAEESDEPVDELKEVEETVTDSEPVESDEFKTITAINTKTNEETELTTEDELVDFATEHELDLDVIDRVLSGEQKTHKGFEFK